MSQDDELCIFNAQISKNLHPCINLKSFYYYRGELNPILRLFLHLVFTFNNLNDLKKLVKLWIVKCVMREKNKFNWINYS